MTPPGFRLLFWKDRTHLIRERAAGPPWLLLCGLETHPTTRPLARLLDPEAEIVRPCARCAAIVAHEAPEPWIWTR